LLAHLGFGEAGVAAFTQHGIECLQQVDDDESRRKSTQTDFVDAIDFPAALTECLRQCDPIGGCAAQIGVNVRAQRPRHRPVPCSLHRSQDAPGHGHAVHLRRALVDAHDARLLSH